MDPQARHLIFHSALVLVAGLLVGVPYGRAVHRNASWVASNYGFCFSLPLSAMVDQRGHTLAKPLSNQLVFVGNMVGLGASSVGTVVLLYAAYVSLP